MSLFASTSGDHGVVSGILDIGGHDKPFMGPVPFIGVIEGVSDVDAVIEGVVGVVGDESWRRARGLVFLIRLLIIDLGVLIIVISRHR